MTRTINVTIHNKLEMEKRDINIYHHSAKSAHIISHNSDITLPFKLIAAGDYLDISLVGRPDHLNCKSIIDLPAWANFEFSSEGKVAICHNEDRTLLKIPPGPPLWQLKITLSSQDNGRYSWNIPGRAQRLDYVIIGDDRVNF